MIIDDFWFGKNNWTYDGLKEFFPDEFVKSFQWYVANFYLEDYVIEGLIIFAKQLSKDEIFRPNSCRCERRSLLLSRELYLFLEWADSQEFKDTYDAYIAKQNSIAEESADTKSEKLTVKENKETARQRRYRIQKNRDYKAKDVIEKFGNKCALCGYEKPAMNENSELYSPSGYMYSFLQLHHILPIKDGGKDTEENLLCLCPNCHIKIHCGDIDKTREDLYLINRKILNKEKE